MHRQQRCGGAWPHVTRGSTEKKTGVPGVGVDTINLSRILCYYCKQIHESLFHYFPFSILTSRAKERICLLITLPHQMEWKSSPLTSQQDAPRSVVGISFKVSRQRKEFVL